jgi:hypothetical protein
MIGPFVLWVSVLACKGDTDTEAPTSPFSLVAEGLPGAALCVQGTSAGDVWIVGSDGGSGPLVTHWDGSAWTTVDVGSAGDLWWVHPTASRVTVVGAGGRIFEIDRATGAVTPIAGPPEVTFYGVWGADEDVWAVGGDPTGDTPPAVWRRTSGTWAPWSDPVLDALAAPTMVYKVHGTSADDVWLVGTQGTMLHFDGTSFATSSSGTTSPLFTVHAGGSEPVAVGGFGQAVIVHFDGSAWVDRSPDFQPQTNGVSGRGDDLVAVGTQGSVQRWDGSTWIADAARPTVFDFHGTWIDEGGGVWAVGGALASMPLSDGVVAYDGPSVISTF